MQPTPVGAFSLPRSRWFTKVICPGWLIRQRSVAQVGRAAHHTRAYAILAIRGLLGLAFPIGVRRLPAHSISIYIGRVFRSTTRPDVPPNQSLEHNRACPFQLRRSLPLRSVLLSIYSGGARRPSPFSDVLFAFYWSYRSCGFRFRAARWLKSVVRCPCHRLCGKLVFWSEALPVYPF